MESYCHEISIFKTLDLFCIYMCFAWGLFKGRGGRDLKKNQLLPLSTFPPFLV